MPSCRGISWLIPWRPGGATAYEPACRVVEAGLSLIRLADQGFGLPGAGAPAEEHDDAAHPFVDGQRHPNPHQAPGQVDAQEPGQGYPDAPHEDHAHINRETDVS